MKTSNLFHIQGSAGFTQVGAVRYVGHDVIYQLALQPSRIKCPKCGSHEVGRRGSVAFMALVPQGIA
jgi:hypothetical protein